MKLKKLLLLTLIVPLTGCNKNTTDLKIISPTGAPAIAFYNYSTNANFETNSGEVSNEIASMVNNSKDIVVLPTNAGVQAITNKKLNYKLAATITFGNLFVLSTGHDEDGVMGDGDYVVAFQKGQLPDLLFHYVYGDSLKSNLHYVESVQIAASCAKAGVDLTNDNKPIDYVLLAEPVLTTVLNEKPDYEVYASIQEEYKNKTGGMDIYQASVFVSSSKSNNTINGFLSSLEEDINNGLKNPTMVKEKIELAGEKASALYGINPKLIPATINKIGLGYKKAIENKSEIDKYLKLFNIGETDEEIYFK